VPLDLPGIEIQPLRTVDGDRTNIVYYSDVRVPDKYRLGEVNDGWAVLRGPLDTEHGVSAPNSDGLEDVSILQHQGSYMATTVDKVAGLTSVPDRTGQCRIDDASVSYRLGRSIARVEAALGTPNMYGRVALAQAMRDVAPELMDILGPASVLPVETRGAVDDGASEYLYRWAPLCGIYGGTLEVFRNMIAQHALGLGRPSYAQTRSKTG
ncbi:acyl-CoA dehydrogenase, partial [Streptomyces sp. SID10244]|nr:acyl-CoA dehydrogenase [Streptomyces sp. SID10244]